MRVQFTLNSYMLSSGKVIAAAREVFGNRVARWANSAQDLTVECSPERFVRFLIARDKYGASNDWKGIRAREIAPVVLPRVESFD